MSAESSPADSSPRDAEEADDENVAYAEHDEAGQDSSGYLTDLPSPPSTPVRSSKSLPGLTSSSSLPQEAALHYPNKYYVDALRSGFEEEQRAQGLTLVDENSGKTFHSLVSGLRIEVAQAEEELKRLQGLVQEKEAEESSLDEEADLFKDVEQETDARFKEKHAAVKKEKANGERDILRQEKRLSRLKERLASAEERRKSALRKKRVENNEEDESVSSDIEEGDPLAKEPKSFWEEKEERLALHKKKDIVQTVSLRVAPIPSLYRERLLSFKRGSIGVCLTSSRDGFNKAVTEFVPTVSLRAAPIPSPYMERLLSFKSVSVGMSSSRSSDVFNKAMKENGTKREKKPDGRRKKSSWTTWRSWEKKPAPKPVARAVDLMQKEVGTSPVMGCCCLETGYGISVATDIWLRKTDESLFYQSLPVGNPDDGDHGNILLKEKEQAILGAIEKNSSSPVPEKVAHKVASLIVKYVWRDDEEYADASLFYHPVPPHPVVHHAHSSANDDDETPSNDEEPTSSSEDEVDGKPKSSDCGLFPLTQEEESLFE